MGAHGILHTARLRVWQGLYLLQQHKWECSDGGWIEKRRHQRDLVILAAVVQLRPVLPAVPKCADDLDLFAQLACDRIGPRLPKPPLDMRSHLRAESENESSIGLCGEIPGGIGDIRRRTREGNRDPCPE